jgi:hypothetical protein
MLFGFRAGNACRNPCPRNRAIFSAACSAVPSRIVDASLTFPIKNDISAMDEIIL